jgi:hypothetical protein
MICSIWRRSIDTLSGSRILIGYPLEASDRRQRDTGVSRRRLQDRLARQQRAVLLGGLDHRLGDPVLDRTERVLHLELGEDPHVGVGRQVGDVDDRRVTDQVEHVGVDGAEPRHRARVPIAQL